MADCNNLAVEPHQKLNHKDYQHMEYNQNEKKDEDLDKGEPQFDPAGETKQKALFFVVAVIVIIVAKFALGL